MNLFIYPQQRLTFYNFFRKELGKIRLNIQLFEERILPWECYVPLINLLVETVKKCPYDEVNTLGLLEQVMTADRTAIGRALVKLYMNQGMIVKLLDALTNVEILSTGMDCLILLDLDHFSCLVTRNISFTKPLYTWSFRNPEHIVSW
jgi:hypothetical protein